MQQQLLTTWYGPCSHSCSMGMCGFAALWAVLWATERAQALSPELCRALGGTVVLYFLVGFVVLFFPLCRTSPSFLAGQSV